MKIVLSFIPSELSLNQHLLSCLLFDVRVADESIKMEEGFVRMIFWNIDEEEDRDRRATNIKDLQFAQASRSCGK